MAKEHVALPNTVQSTSNVRMNQNVAYEKPHKWEKAFQRLKQHHDLTGTTDVNADDFPRLAAWVSKQRQKYKDGLLPLERKEELDSISFDFQIQRAAHSYNYKDVAWNEHFQELLRFKEKYGHCDVSKYTEEFKVLGGWVYRQRKWHRENSIRPDRKKMLADIGFQFEILNEKWNNKFLLLKEFCTINGTHQIPRVGPAANNMLSGWACRQRSKFHRGKLDAEKEAMLRSINFPLNALSETGKRQKADADWNDTDRKEDTGGGATPTRVKRPRLANSQAISYADEEDSELEAGGPHGMHAEGANATTGKRSGSGEDRESEVEIVAEAEATQSLDVAAMEDDKTEVPAHGGVSTLSAQGNGANVSGLPSCIRQTGEETSLVLDSVAGSTAGVDVFERLMPLIIDLRFNATEACLADCAKFMELILTRQGVKVEGISGDEEEGAYSRLMALIMDMETALQAPPSCGGEAIVSKCELYLNRTVENVSSRSK